MPLDEVVAIALGIARGLSDAHVRGIVHRDLKPENAFLRSDGVPKILDFGLAKLQLPIDDQTTAASHTMTGVIVGTAGSMAPEQVKGEPVDGRADLFALGVMLYEMLGGRHPFKRASTFETLHAILTTDPPDVSTFGRNVPLRWRDQTFGREGSRGALRPPSTGWALEQVGLRLDDQAATPQRSAETLPFWSSRWLPWVAALTAAAFLSVS